MKQKKNTINNESIKSKINKNCWEYADFGTKETYFYFLYMIVRFKRIIYEESNSIIYINNH